MEEEKRKLAAKEQAAKEQAAKEQELSSFTRQLQEGLTVLDSLSDACVLDPSGQLLGEAHRNPESAEGLKELRDCLHALAACYSRPGMRRVLIEDGAGSVVLARMAEDRALIAVADKGVPAGVVTVQAGKLMSRLSA